MEENSLNAPSNDVVPLVKSFSLTAPDAGQVSQATPDEAALPTPTFEVSYKGKCKVSV